MPEVFPNLGKEMDIQVQEAQRVPKKMKPRSTKLRQTIIKMSKIKDKERILKSARQKQLVKFKGNPISLLANFLEETL